MDNRILIAYYSWSGNTEHIAGLIQKKTGGRLFNIEPVVDYPGNYNSCVNQAKKEINTDFMPELKAIPCDLSDYDIIFTGSPIWWYTMAPPVLSFLSNADLAGKKIVPFCTHGGGGKGHFINNVVKCCPNSTVLDELVLYGNGGRKADAEISAWFNRIGITGKQ